jgi:spermidine synthase
LYPVDLCSTEAARVDERVVARRWSAGQEIAVRDRKGYREMVARDTRTDREMIWSRARIDDPSRSGWPYVDLFHVAAGLARRRERALFIGCGGAVAPRQFAGCYPGIQLDVVESQATVIELARAFFAMGDIPNVTAYLADGASFLRRSNPGSWDVVIVDAYDGDQLGRDIGGRGFFTAIRRALRPGGAMAFNVVGSLDGTNPVAAVARSAVGAFPDLRLVPVMTGTEAYAPSAVRNVVLIGVRGD